jgi:CheY-like chemotaxis protein
MIHSILKRASQSVDGSDSSVMDIHENRYAMKKKIILLVDDSSMIRYVAGRILRDLGHEVVIAQNGKEAFEMARMYKPALIIMDIEMPVMDGIQATACIKSDSEISHIPVLVFTGLGGEDVVAQARDAGCQGFLNKPISKDLMQSEVIKLIGN